MRHLLEVLRKDFKEPTNIPTCTTELDKKENGLLDAFLPHLESEREKGKVKENNDLFPYASLIKDCNSPDYFDPLFVSTPLRTASPSMRNDREGEDDNLEKDISSQRLSEHVSNNTGNSEEDFLQNQIGTSATNEVSDENHEYTTIIGDTGIHEEQAEDGSDKQCKEIEDLGKSLSESLHVSSNTHCNHVENTEHHTDTDASVSDDEF